MHKRTTAAKFIFVCLTLPLVAGCDLILGEGRRATTIIVSPSDVSFDAVLETHILTAEVFDQDGVLLPNRQVAWSSSDPTVAQVSPEGVVTSVGNGSATISATLRSVSGIASTTVMQQPTAISVHGGETQEGVVGELLGFPLEVLVTDRLGSPARGVDVVFEVTAGGGSIAPATATTGPSGIASADWILGEAAGSEQSLNARVAAPADLSVEFAASARAGPPDRLVKESGDGQIGQRATQLAEPLRIQVLDRFGNPVPEVSVLWQVQSGGGDLDPVEAVTDPGGRANSSWLLGAALGTQEVVAAVDGDAGEALFSAIAIAVPEELRVAEGDGQSATVGEAVPTPPKVMVFDGQGRPIPFVTVVFSVESGDGSLVSGPSVGSGPAATPAITLQTDESGIAGPSAWVLGTTAGQNVTRATVEGVDAILFAATGVAAPATLLTRVSGDSQTGSVSTQLPLPLVTRVTDVFGNPVSGIAVLFTPSSGSGSTFPTQAVSLPDGSASTSWTLGTTPGAQGVTASFPEANPVTFSATGVASGGGGPGFDIVFDYVNAVSGPVQAAFDAAAARWSSIITGDLADITFTIPSPSSCSNPNPLTLTFDDVYIFVTISPIDGVGGTLGSAGPCFLRSPSFQPFAGSMVLDDADVNSLLASGQLDDVIMHEVGHVLGIGTLWGLFGFLQDPSSPGATPPPDTHFNGPAAIVAFDQVGGASYPDAKVPVENEQGGSGTLNSHWRESVLGTELMTGFISGGSNPLSRVTAASLTDLGYQVDESAADPYSLPPPLAPPLGPPSTLVPIDSIVVGPIGIVDESGEVIDTLEP